MRGEVIDFNNPRAPRDRAAEYRRLAYQAAVFIGAFIVPIVTGLLVALPCLLVHTYRSKNGIAIREALNKWRLDCEDTHWRVFERFLRIGEKR